ncbi:MAG: GDSL-type esterase/lipase family protein, partial [Longicatena sp.]
MKKRISKVILATALLFGSVATNIKASEKVDFVAIGDSITTGYGLPGYTANPPYAEDSFVEVLKETKSFNTTNMGKDGITSEMLIQGFQLMSGPQKTIIQEADVISVTIGGNDLLSRFMGDIATKLGIDPRDTAAIITVLSKPDLKQSVIIGMVLNDIKNDLPNMVQTFSTNLNTIIQNIKAINPDGKIIVQT